MEQYTLHSDESIELYPYATTLYRPRLPDSYKDLMDLGMNVEARVASEILGSASQFLGHAITARNAKINKKLKMIDLLLKKAKLDNDSDEPSTTTGEGKMLDRNELLAEVLKAAKAADKDSKIK